MLIAFLEINELIFMDLVAGGVYNQDNWRSMARSKLVLLARRRPDLLDAGFSTLNVQIEAGTSKEMESLHLNADVMTHEEQNRWYIC